MYSKEQIEKITKIICNGIAEGSSLRKVLLNNKNLPNLSLIIQWLADADRKKEESKYYNLLLQYERARAIQADTLVDEILDISDDATNDYAVDENGKKIVDHEHLQRSRLRVDTRKWIAGKQRPKKYGDKIDVSRVITVQDISDDDLDSRIKQLLNDTK